MATYYTLEELQKKAKRKGIPLSRSGKKKTKAQLCRALHLKCKKRCGSPCRKRRSRRPSIATALPPLGVNTSLTPIANGYGYNTSLTPIANGYGYYGPNFTPDSNWFDQYGLGGGGGANPIANGSGFFGPNRGIVGAVSDGLASLKKAVTGS